MPDPVVSGSSGPRFLAALAGDHKRIVKVEVWHNGTYLDTLPNLTAGSVAVDETAQVRRTCTLTIESEGRQKDILALIPDKPGDLLHPSSQNELVISRGIQYRDGSQDWCQLGVFRMTKPVTKDTGGSITIAVTGNDRSVAVTRNKWTQPFVIAGGTDLATAVKNILVDRWFPVAPLAYDFTPTNPVPYGYGGAGQVYQVPPTTLGLNLASANDPWADAISLASAPGFEVFFGPAGNPYLRPVLVPTNLAPSFPLLYEEGPECVFNEVDRTLDETQTFNGAIALGTGTGGAPVQGVAWNTDPTSATYYDPAHPTLSEWGPSPYIFEVQSIPGPGDTTLQAQAKITAAAQAKLQQILTALDVDTFQCVPNPALREGDVIGILRQRIALNTTDDEGNVVPINRVVQKMTLPLDVSSLMSVTCRPQLQPS